MEIVARNEFWRKAVQVEWRHQFPERTLAPEPEGFYRIEPGWLDDLERVARRCFSEVAIAPDEPGRLAWLRRLTRRRDS